MRRYPRLNRVAYGILGRQRPRVFTLLEQNDGVGLCSRWDSGEIPAAVRRQSSIARPSHRTYAVSQLLCAGGPLPSQIICAGKDHLLHVGPFIIAATGNHAPV
jgi:hypothetical protein